MRLSTAAGMIPFGAYTGEARSTSGRLRRGSWGGARVVLFLLLTIGNLAIEPFDRGLDTQASHLAALVAGTPGPAITEHPAFQLTIPADAVPSGDTIVHSIVAYTTTGQSATWEPYCCSGPVVEYVVEGKIAYKAMAPIQVTRANGTVEEIPAETEVILEPGDGLLTRIETAIETKNLSEGTAVVLTWLAIGDDSEGFGGREHTGWVEHGVGFQVWPTAITGPVTLRLEPVTLTVGDEVPIPPGELKLVVVAGNEVYISRPQTGTETSFKVQGAEGKSSLGYILTLEPRNPVAASPVAATPTS